MTAGSPAEGSARPLFGYDGCAQLARRERSEGARDPGLPDVPTARESGVDVDLEAWRGIAVPKGTPAATIAMVEKAVRQTVESAEFSQGTEKLYVRPAFLGTQELGDLIAREDAQLARLMQAIGIKK